MDVTSCTWLPVGTPEEYLAANLNPPALSYLDADARARAAGAVLEPGLVIGAGAKLGPGARLEEAVVWDGERVPAGFEGDTGVFAGGRFHPCGSSAGES
jgi:mannose-1-phosphate guanylyltransferase